MRDREPQGYGVSPEIGSRVHTRFVVPMAAAQTAKGEVVVSTGLRDRLSKVVACSNMRPTNPIQAHCWSDCTVRKAFSLSPFLWTDSRCT